MSMIMEQAGGKATTGTHRALETPATKVHQRCPIYLGCNRDVDLILKFLSEDKEAGHGTPGVELAGLPAGGAGTAATAV